MPRNYEVSIDGLAVRFAQAAQVLQDQPDVPLFTAATPGDLPALLERARLAPAVSRVTIAFPDVEAAWDSFRADHVSVEAAGGAVTDERGRLLAIHRLGRWDLPKGKVDPGEELPAAAVREVREECGLSEVSIVRPLCESWHTYERDGRQHLKRTSWFLMRASSADRLVAQAEEDIREVCWMDRDGLERMRAHTYATVLEVISAWERQVHPRPA